MLICHLQLRFNAFQKASYETNKIMISRKAFSLIEVLFAAAIMTIAVLPLLWMTRYSNKSTMDAYYELLAMTLAKEPIQVFRAIGYSDLVLNINNPHPDFPVGEQQIPCDGIKRPVEASAFKRKIQLEVLSAEKAVRVMVSVFPGGQNRVSTWISNDSVTMEALIFEKIR
ncbi:MAG: prepilin-type N-terminal cleavage/methylation domain-containing protein [Candidatus Riflebacteria bacterium]|nr:prepilin-type N-terminal cleavage/methylation domain-containing protein [Candidatus Riflebacteria bacterium]